MTKIKTLSRDYPVLFSVLFCVVFLACMRLAGWLYRLTPRTDLWYFLSEAFDALWPVALSLVLGFGYIYHGKGVGATLVPALPSFFLRTFVLAVAVYTAVTEGAQWKPVSAILGGFMSLVGVGIREEVVFRGIIGNALARKYATDGKGLWKTVILSAALFSGVHLQNLFLGLDPVAMIAQLVGAFGMGMIFMAVYIRGGNIWVLIVLHSIVDASGLFESTFTQNALGAIEEMGEMNLGGLLILMPIHLGLTMFLLRKSRRPAIFARLEKLREASAN